MDPAVYRFTFQRERDCAEAESTLHLAIIAVEGLCGEARVRLDAGHHIDRPHCCITVDATTQVGLAVASVFTSLLLRGFGKSFFAVHRINGAPCSRRKDRAA